VPKSQGLGKHAQEKKESEEKGRKSQRNPLNKPRKHVRKNFRGITIRKEGFFSTEGKINHAGGSKKKKLEEKIFEERPGRGLLVPNLQDESSGLERIMGGIRKNEASRKLREEAYKRKVTFQGQQRDSREKSLEDIYSKNVEILQR